MAARASRPKVSLTDWVNEQGSVQQRWLRRRKAGRGLPRYHQAASAVGTAPATRRAGARQRRIGWRLLGRGRWLRWGCWSGSMWGGGMKSGWPSLAMVMGQPSWWMVRWWRRQSRTALVRLVGPPLSHDRMWCASHQAGGLSQVGKVQPWSRRFRAWRSGPVKSRRLRPRSRISVLVLRTAGMIRASQAIRRAVLALIGSPVFSVAVPICWVRVS